jgi:subtilisin family serine protease
MQKRNVKLYMENNIDPQLELAIQTDKASYEATDELYVGYNSTSQTWKLLIRYSADISDLVEMYLEKIYYLLQNYAIITIRQEYIFKFASDIRIIYIEKPKSIHDQVSYAQYSSCLDGTFINNYGLKGEGVLVAVIDSGIDYSHSEFIQNGKSRIYSLWDQTQTFSPQNNNIYGVGHIYSNEDLENILNGVNTTEKPSADISGHGTQVAAIAAGTNVGMAPLSDIIAVKIAGDTSGDIPSTLGIILGIDYSLRAAFAINKPIAINISYGNNYGSHAGNSLLENYIDDVLRISKAVIVTGTGNDALNGRHSRVILGNISYSLVDFIVGEYVTSFNIQLWKNYADLFEVYVIAPTGEIVLNLREMQSTAMGRYNKTSIKGIYGAPNPYSREQEIFISFSGTDKYADSGYWKLLLYPKMIVNGNVNIYLPVKAAISGNVEFTNPDVYGTLSIPSTSKGIISVAAYDQNTNDYAYFSGRGYTTNDSIKPDIAAPGVDIYTAYPGNIYSFATGTSMAAPFVTGASALLMEWGVVKGNDMFLYGEKVKAYLQRGARKLPGFTEYPNREIGYGALCVKNSLPV